jgi:hypothetical protein
MKQYTNNDIKDLLNKLPQHIHVAFAVYCAENCIDNYTFKDKQLLQHCIDLCKKGLVNSNSVTKSELEAAAHSAVLHAHSAHSAYSAYSAAHSAYSAAHSAAHSAARDKKTNEQYIHLLNLAENLTELEKILWRLE